MTKEQIEKNAKVYACTISEGPTARHTLSYRAHIAGAESRQPEIDEACEIISKLLYMRSSLTVISDMAERQKIKEEARQFLKEQNYE